MAVVRLSAALLLIAGTAAATPIVTAPAGWVTDPEQAAKIGKHGDAAVEVYVPRSPGIALIVSRASGPASASEARRAIDELYGEGDRAQMLSPKAQITNRSDVYDPARKQLLATQNVKSDTLTISSVVFAMDAAHASTVVGQCVIADGVAKPLLDQCTAALATLDPAVAERVAFEVPAALAVNEPPTRAQPSMSDGSKFQMQPIEVEQPEQKGATDMRPIYVGAGLVVLAAIFWFNRRQRDKFGKDDAHG